MLGRWSGSTHEVLSSVTVLHRLTSDGAWRTEAFTEVTEVSFRTLTEEVIEAYLDTGEYLDKAGGYGVQGFGSALVEGVRGDYFNVVGFPVCAFARCMEEIMQEYKPSLVRDKPSEIERN